MDTIDNKNKTLRDDLVVEIKQGSKLSIAAACFSIYAFQELKKQLKGIDELRFIFTSPTFTKEKAQKEKREFYIPRLDRERSLYGTEFEVKLRNELTQKAIAKECADWIRQKVTFRSNATGSSIQGFLITESAEYTPIKEFTREGLGCEQGADILTTIVKAKAPETLNLLEQFEAIWNDPNCVQDVTDVVLDRITAAYNENSPEFIYFVTLSNIFRDYLQSVSEDTLPNEAVGFKQSRIWNMLYNFQKDAALSIINRLEKYNGCILADSVGLGKTFTALAVIKYYESRNKTVLVLCPKKLSYNWMTYRDNYKNNPIAEDKLNYKVLYHTDIGRTQGESNGTDLSRLRWDTYDLVVIDESHNFRNGGKLDRDEDQKANRYVKLFEEVIEKGVKTKVLMLSATPVNTRFFDLRNQLQLAYGRDSSHLDAQLNTSRPINEIFRNAQTAFNTWSRLAPRERTTNGLLQMLDHDFFEVLDSVTIARSRKHIESFYDTTEIGKFPRRLPPEAREPSLTDLPGNINYDEIFRHLLQLNLDIYRPSHYIQRSKMDKYAELFGDDRVNVGFTQVNREMGIRRLMAINLMKRLESSVYSFGLTLSRIKALIESTLEKLDRYDNARSAALSLEDWSDMEDYDWDDQNSDDFAAVGRRVQIDLADMDRESWRGELRKDVEVLSRVLAMVEQITPAHDSKLQALFAVLKSKVEAPFNEGNRKVLIFTAFADTAMYLYDQVSAYMLENYGLHTAVITGSTDGKTTVPRLGGKMNDILTCFSPVSKDKAVLLPQVEADIDVLIATDCISEGQNLQDCDYLVNFDIHWNPVRIIQRFGRIDRIGSQNEKIQMLNFWPDITLEEYIDLKARVESRMKIVNLTATGDDYVLSDEEKNDLEFRKLQLQKIKTEAVDIEDISGGISIMDLGLNDFQLEAQECVKAHPELETAPLGLHAVAPAAEGTPPGVIYILRNRTESVNAVSQNRLHPYYMVYISDEGEVLCDHLSPKAMLDRMRRVCKGRTVPIPELYKPFNQETRDGHDMSHLSQLLGEAISSIIQVKGQSDVEAFLRGSQVSFAREVIRGLDDFELICFLVIR